MPRLQLFNHLNSGGYNGPNTLSPRVSNGLINRSNNSSAEISSQRISGPELFRVPNVNLYSCGEYMGRSTTDPQTGLSIAIRPM